MYYIGMIIKGNLRDKTMNEKLMCKPNCDQQSNLAVDHK